MKNLPNIVILASWAGSVKSSKSWFCFTTSLYTEFSFLLRRFRQEDSCNLMKSILGKSPEYPAIPLLVRTNTQVSLTKHSGPDQ